MVHARSTNRQRQWSIVLLSVLVFSAVTLMVATPHNLPTSDKLQGPLGQPMTSEAFTHPSQPSPMESPHLSPKARDAIWSETLGGTEDDVFYDVIECSAGGFIAVGYTESLGAGDEDVWLVRYDANGGYLWDNTFGGEEADYGLGVVECTGGGYALTGYTESFGANPSATKDLWLIRVNDAGDHMWNQTFGGQDDEVGYSLIECSGGGFAIVGKSGVGGGGMDGYLVRSDDTGSLLFNQTYGGPSNDEIRDILEISGGFILVGWNHISTSGDDGWWIQVDTSGNIQIQRSFSERHNDYFYSVIACSGGGYILAGYTKILNGSPDAWLVRILTDGTLQWSRTFGGRYSDVVRGVVECSSGGFAIGGRSNSYSDASDGDTDYHDAWVVRTNSSGIHLWNRTYRAYDGRLRDNAFCFIEVSGGDFVLAGRYYLSSNYNAWLAKVPDLPLWWDQDPRNQTLFPDVGFRYDLNASAWGGIDAWWLGETSRFAINEEGIITNTTTLSEKIWYWVYVYVNDTGGNILTSRFGVYVRVSPPPFWLGPALGLAFLAIIILIAGILLWRRARRIEKAEPLEKGTHERHIAEERDSTIVTGR